MCPQGGRRPARRHEHSGCAAHPSHHPLPTLPLRPSQPPTPPPHASARACLSHGFTSTLGAAAAAAAAARAAWDKEVSAFRAEAQPKATRREWDLSRPDALQIDTPARIGDDDPRCGPASMQRFYGEDLLVSNWRAPY
jgi:hypothetical protein